MANPKPVEFRGSSLDDLRAFPAAAKREAGHQIDLVQNGEDPDDWKPMGTVGSGVKEIRIRDEAGHSESFMWRNSLMPSTCCIASRKKPSRPANTISIWQSSATVN